MLVENCDHIKLPSHLRPGQHPTGAHDFLMERDRRRHPDAERNDAEAAWQAYRSDFPEQERVKVYGVAFSVLGIIAACDQNFDRLKARSNNVLTKEVALAFANFEDRWKTGKYDETTGGPLFEIHFVTKLAFAAIDAGDITRIDQLIERQTVEGSNKRTDCHALDDEPMFSDPEIEARYRWSQKVSAANAAEIEANRQAHINRRMTMPLSY